MKCKRRERQREGSKKKKKKEKEVTASPVVVKKEEVKKVVNPRSRKGPGTEHWSGYPPERSLTLLGNGPFHLTVAIKVDPL